MLNYFFFFFFKGNKGEMLVYKEVARTDITSFPNINVALTSIGLKRKKKYIYSKENPHCYRGTYIAKAFTQLGYNQKIAVKQSLIIIPNKQLRGDTSIILGAFTRGC